MRVPSKSAHPSPSGSPSAPAVAPPVPLGLADLARALTVLYIPPDVAELAKSLTLAEVAP